MADDLSVRLGGIDVLLRPLRTAVGVRYVEPAPTAARERLADQLGLADTYRRRLELPGERFTVYPLPASAAYDQVLARAAAAPEVGTARQLYVYGSITVMPTERVVFASVDPAVAEEITRRGLTVTEVRSGTYSVTLRETENAFETSAQLSRVAGVQWAEPDLVIIGARERTGRAVGPSATPGIGYADELIGAPQARALTAMGPVPTVAILDDGIDSNHPGLAGAVIGGEDIAGGQTGGAPNSWDYHGTACAGLIAARSTANGVLGVASGCRLLAVRVASSPRAGAPWSTSATTLAAGVYWAVNAGADVISLSWGGAVPSSAIEAALSAARSRGRSGQGIVVLAAAGNVPGPVDYPAASSQVLAVSATNQVDEFKTPYSSDQEPWWGSASGSQVDLAAPSVALRTLDVVGAGGQNPTDVLSFSGTSAGTPIVAGAVALILRAAPSSSAQEVIDCLAATAVKTGVQPYLNGRNDQLGWGRVNVAAAVRRALGLSSAPDVGVPGDGAETGNETGNDPAGGTGAGAATLGPGSQPGPNEVLLPVAGGGGQGAAEPGSGRSGAGRQPGPNEVLLPVAGGGGQGAAEPGSGRSGAGRQPGPNEVLLPV
jgi:subtilisin family serine protease